MKNFSTSPTGTFALQAFLTSINQHYSLVPNPPLPASKNQNDKFLAMLKKPSPFTDFKSRHKACTINKTPLKKAIFMKTKTMILGALATSLMTSALAKDVLHIVGSSTVYPFSSAVAEEFGLTTDYKTPLVESTGSGGGFKLFCAGIGKSTPDITNASRRIKVKEYKKCQKNGVKSITEAMIGYDGIAVANSKKSTNMRLTTKHLLLALAAKVPSKNGKQLINNPYTRWSQIDSSLPNRKIRVYGPPTSSGTRDAFEELVLQKLSKKIPAYGGKKYSKIREDGVYIPSGENDNLIVQKLTKDRVALGIFGFGFLAENADKIKATTVNGISPSSQSIADGSYPIARSLFFYIKNAKRTDMLEEFVELFMSEDMIAPDGYLSELSLIPLADDLREDITNSVLSYKRLDSKGLK